MADFFMASAKTFKSDRWQLANQFPGSYLPEHLADKLKSDLVFDRSGKPSINTVVLVENLNCRQPSPLMFSEDVGDFRKGSKWWRLAEAPFETIARRRQALGAWYEDRGLLPPEPPRAKPRRARRQQTLQVMAPDNFHGRNDGPGPDLSDIPI